MVTLAGDLSKQLAGNRERYIALSQTSHSLEKFKGKDEATVSRLLAVPGSPPGAGSPQLGQAWRGFQIQPRVGQQKAIWFQQNQHWRVIVT
ncbi:hypothetical protein AGOR_G00053210 [Albula goreensis]|uniref:Uncharacterized protein n=1 Tax=Albula goreensis TaxID=1534307 RepID=A0A8T3DV00_9TELE|nr:hypothetical protein AGOR_G00053210 [Albula goreensis]